MIIDALGSLNFSDGFSLDVQTKPCRSRSGWIFLSAFLVSSTGVRSEDPFVTGIVSNGGRGIMPWLDCRVQPKVSFPDREVVDARALSFERRVIELFGEIIPAGGHLMLDYECPGNEETFVALTLGIPPIATHLGYLMFCAGFRGRFKDWYFPEGGCEGYRKLQGNKPWSQESELEALREHRVELRSFVDKKIDRSSRHAPVFLAAKERALALLADQLL